MTTRQTRQLGAVIAAVLTITSVAAVGGLAQPAGSLSASTVSAQTSAGPHVTGALAYADGSTVDGWKVMADGDDSHFSTFTSNGNFSLAVDADDTYNLKYEQFTGDGSESWPIDGRPDIHALGEVSVGTSNESVGDLQLPEAYRLDVTVVDQAGDPIEDADVFVAQHANGARSSNDAVTNADGEAGWVGSDHVGLELRGAVEIHVEGPPGYADDSAELTVTGNRSLTVTLQPSVNVSGRVLEPDGSPAADDWIRFAGIEEVGTDDWQGTETDGNGDFSEELREGGSYVAGYQQGDPDDESDTMWPTDGVPDVYALERLDLGSSDADVGTRQLPTAHRLNVTVVDEDGNPVEDAEVNVGHGADDARTWAHAPTNGAGLMEHPESDGPGLEVVGDVTVHIEPPEGRALSENGTELTVSGDRGLTLVLHPTVEVTGEVFDADGEPPTGYEVSLWGEQDGGATGQVESNGSFAISVAENHTYQFGFRQTLGDNLREYFPRDGVPDVYAIGTGYVGDEPVNLGTNHLPRANLLNVTVVDETGTPVEGADVNVGHRNGETSHWIPGHTTADGQLLLERAAQPGVEANGTVELDVEPPDGSDLADRHLTVDLQSDRDVVVELPEVVPVSGQLEYADGTPAAATTVHLHGRDGTDDNHQAITDEQGRFEVGALPNASYNVHYHQDDFTNDSDVAFPTDGNPDIFGVDRIDTGASGVDLGTVTLSGAHQVQVQVVDTDGAPIEDATVRVYHNPGDTGPAANLRPNGAPTNADGLLEVPDGDGRGLDLVGGIGVLVLPPEGSGLVSNGTEFTVTDDTNVTVVLEEGANVLGRITQPDGSPAAHEKIRLNPRGSQHVDRTWTDGDGTFAGSTWQDATVDVGFYQVAGEGAFVPTTPRDGIPDVYLVERVDTASDVDVGEHQLPPAHVLNVTVVDTAGQPVEDARVNVAHWKGDAWAHHDVSTDGAGRMGSGGTVGVEVVGEIEVRVDPPSDSSLAGNGTFLDVSNDTDLTVVLEEKVEVRGRVLEADGEPAVNHAVAALAEDPLGGQDRFLRTDTDGNFSVDVATNTSHDVQYYQATFTGTSEVTADSFPRDGSPDMVAVERVDTSGVTGTVDVGTTALENADPLNVSVVDGSGAPVANATLAVEHLNADDPSDAGLAELKTNGDGLLDLSHSFDIPGGPPPGIELSGTVTIEVSPPDDPRFANETYARTVDASNRTTVTVQLEEAPLAISHVRGVTTGDGVNTTRQVAVEANRDLVLDDGTNYHFELTNEDTGDAVTLALNGSVVVPAGDPVGLLAYHGDGAPRSSPRIWPAIQSDPLPADVVAGSVPAATGVTNYSAALLNASDGSVVDETAVEPAVVGYAGVLAQNDTAGTVRLSIPRGVVPEDADVDLVLSEGEFGDGSEVFEFEMEYDAATDEFATLVDASSFNGGDHSWRTAFTWQGTEILRIPGHTTDNEYVTFVGEDSGGSGGTGGIETNVTMTPPAADVPVSGETTFDVVVEEASGGVGAHDLTVALGNASVAEITDVQLHGDPPDSTSEVSIAADGSSASMTAALMNTTQDTGAVTVATITVAGNATGTSDVNLTVDAIGNEDGVDYNVTGTGDAVVNVTNVPVVGEYDSPPTDPDGDGLYEDVNGNGEFNIVDVQAMFANRDDSSMVDNPQFFDHSGNGEVDVVDVQALFTEEIQ